MPAMVEDIFLDLGLTAAQAGLSQIILCSSEPTTFAEATTTYLLGFKDFGAGSAFTGPVASVPTGRKLTSVSVTEGTITTTGTASWWAAVGTASLYAHGLIASPQEVNATNTFTLGVFDIRIRSTE